MSHGCEVICGIKMCAFFLEHIRSFPLLFVCVSLSLWWGLSRRGFFWRGISCTFWGAVFPSISSTSSPTHLSRARSAARTECRVLLTSTQAPYSCAVCIVRSLARFSPPACACAYFGSTTSANGELRWHVTICRASRVMIIKPFTPALCVCANVFVCRSIDISVK